MKMWSWVALVLVLSCYSYYCNAQLLEEGSTVTTEILSSDGEITEIEETTVTVEHKTTGDILDVDNGIVSANKAGTLEIDWGGLGPIHGMVDCTAIFGEDTGKCGLSRSSNLTTFQQYVTLPEGFEINQGGQIDWQLNLHHKQNNTTAYFETKGYLDNILQWQTGQINLPDYDTPSLYSGTHDFAGGLDKVFISIGGYNEYYVDNVQYIVHYNSITTTIEHYLEIVQPTIVANEIFSVVDIPVYETPIFDVAEIEIFNEVDDPIVELPEMEIEVVEQEITVAEQIEEIFTETEEVLEETPEMVVETENEEIKTPENELSEEVESVEIETPSEESKSTDEAKNQQENDKPSKQEKANRIMQTFNNIYSEEAQQTQLFLIMALGTDFKTYEQKTYVPQINPYEQYVLEDTLVMEDLYGDYFSVGNSLMFKQMVDSQYNE